MTESATTVVEGAVALQVVRFGLKAAQGKAKEASVDAAKDGLTMLRNTPEVAVVGQKKWLKLGASVVIDGLGVAVSCGGGPRTKSKRGGWLSCSLLGARACRRRLTRARACRPTCSPGSARRGTPPGRQSRPCWSRPCTGRPC